MRKDEEYAHALATFAEGNHQDREEVVSAALAVVDATKKQCALFRFWVAQSLDAAFRGEDWFTFDAKTIAEKKMASRSVAFDTVNFFKRNGLLQRFGRSRLNADPKQGNVAALIRIDWPGVYAATKRRRGVNREATMRREESGATHGRRPDTDSPDGGQSFLVPVVMPQEAQSFTHPLSDFQGYPLSDFRNSDKPPCPKTAEIGRIRTSPLVRNSKFGQAPLSEIRTGEHTQGDARNDACVRARGTVVVVVNIITTTTHTLEARNQLCAVMEAFKPWRPSDAMRIELRAAAVIAAAWRGQDWLKESIAAFKGVDWLKISASRESYFQGICRRLAGAFEAGDEDFFDRNEWRSIWWAAKRDAETWPAQPQAALPQAAMHEKLDPRPRTAEEQAAIDAHRAKIDRHSAAQREKARREAEAERQAELARNTKGVCGGVRFETPAEP